MGNGNTSMSRSASQGLDEGDEDDDEDTNDADDKHSSIFVPNEIKPRGRLGVKTGSSKKVFKSGSLQSALSVEMENPEADKIKKEFEMYRMNKENEIANIQKSEKRTIAENKRLRNELQALQRTCNRLRSEREEALQAEQQALARATAFETDRDKVQRQFKIFRETKEKEIQNLLRAKRDLESKLAKGTLDLLPDESRVPSGSVGSNDWWALLDNAQSEGSIALPPLRGANEFTSSLLQLEMAQGLARDLWGFSPECISKSVLQLFISYTEDMAPEVIMFEQVVLPEIRLLVENDGHYLNVIKFPHFNDLQGIVTDEKLKELRAQYADQSTVMLGFIGEKNNAFTFAEVNGGHLKNPGGKPAIFCMRPSETNADSEINHMKIEIRRTGEAKVIDSNQNSEDLMFLLGKELKNFFFTIILKLKKLMELGIDPDKPDCMEETSADSGFSDIDNECFGCVIWDENCHAEHMEAFYNATKHVYDCCLEKLVERLNNHIVAPGPLPPLLVLGSPGSGKSHLLAKWIQQHQNRGNAGVVLYHFVGCRNSISADPVHMIRRFTSQLMQHAVNPPSLTCDPSRLMEEFPRWLEKVSSKTPGGVTVVIDGLDKLLQADINCRWLLDPLPVDSRVIVSVNEETCLPSWKSWLHLKIEPLNVRNVKDLLRNELQQKGCYLDSESEAKILTHCRTAETCNPLYITVLAACLARIGDEKKLLHQLDQCLAADDAVSLYLVILDYLREELETTEETKGCMKKVLKLIYASRNGLGDWEILSLFPNITWTFWGILTTTLLSFHVILYRGGVITLAHDLVYEAVAIKYFPSSDEGKQLSLSRKTLVNYFSQYVSPSAVTCRVADELPWLYQQLADKEAVKKTVMCLCVFLKLYVRGRCNELIGYWQFIGIDKNKMAELYFSITQTYESMADKQPYLTIARVADMYEAQGTFLRDLGMLKEACNPLQRALELRETTLDPDHPRVAQSLHQLASLHAQWNKFSAAESLYKQALDIYQNAFGPDHILVAKELDALVVLYQKQNKHEVAEPLKKQANNIRKKNKVPRINTSEDTDNIRSASFKKGKKSGMHLEELSMGPETPQLATKLNELGVLYYIQGNHSTAETFFKRSLQIREGLLPADHKDLGQSYKNLAALYEDQGDLNKAECLYEKALEIKLQNFTADHPRVIALSKNLAHIYKKLQKWNKAEPLYKKLVDIRERLAGDKPDPSQATALVNLAVIYCHMNRQTDAEPLYDRALKIYESTLGVHHPRVAETLHNIAVFKYEQGDYEAAANLYKKANEIKLCSPPPKKSNPASRTSSGLSLPIASPAVTPTKTQKVFIKTLEQNS